jgi:hypothetical protein
MPCSPGSDCTGPIWRWRCWASPCCGFSSPPTAASGSGREAMRFVPHPARATGTAALMLDVIVERSSCRRPCSVPSPAGAAGHAYLRLVRSDRPGRIDIRRRIAWTPSRRRWLGGVDVVRRPARLGSPSRRGAAGDLVASRMRTAGEYGCWAALALAAGFGAGCVRAPSLRRRRST